MSKKVKKMTLKELENKIQEASKHHTLRACLSLYFSISLFFLDK
jgi:hypothetical protein